MTKSKGKNSYGTHKGHTVRYSSFLEVRHNISKGHKGGTRYNEQRKLPFKLFCPCPQGNEFPWKPHTGESYHSTSNTFNRITVSHTLTVSLPNTHTHTNIEPTPDCQGKLCCFTHTLFYLQRRNTHIHMQTVTLTQPTRSPFNERMPRGISWHQPNDQATAHVGKCGILQMKIIKPTLQLKLWHLAQAAKWLKHEAYIWLTCQNNSSSHLCRCSNSWEMNSCTESAFGASGSFRVHLQLPNNP